MKKIERVKRVSCIAWAYSVYIVWLEFVPAFEISWRHRSEIWILLLNSARLFLDGRLLLVRWKWVNIFGIRSVEKKEGIERDKCFAGFLGRKDDSSVNLLLGESKVVV